MHVDAKRASRMSEKSARRAPAALNADNLIFPK